MSPVHGQQGAEEIIDVDSIDLKDMEQRELPGFAQQGEVTISEYENEWWAIEVEFETLVEMLEEVEVRVYLEGYDMLGRNREPMDNPVTLVADLTLINLLEGKHVATFYLHPGAAKRYGGNKARDFKKYIYRIEIRSGGDIIFEGDSEDELDPGWHRTGQIEDVLLPVHKSPWWPFETRRYDQIQTERR